tara:strand:+ start:311 stop:1120 length:810 start_codon:yes stop_codon:yes gene_type:complete
MSGSSSLASARRRRAAPQQSEPPIIQNKINEQTNEKKMAPLELLQLHDTKIASIQDNIENMVTNLVAEKLSKINFQGYNLAIKKLQEDIVNIKNTPSGGPIESNNMLIDEEKVTSIVNSYISDNLYQEMNISTVNIVDKKVAPLSSSLASVIENMESVTLNMNNNIINRDKVEELLLEVNSLKILLIKNQTLALESSGEINKIKDKLDTIDSEIRNIKENYSKNVVDENKKISILKNELDIIHEMRKKITGGEKDNNLTEVNAITSSLE